MVLALAAISGSFLTAAALPRMCGVTENVVDAYLLEHPRIAFMLGLAVWLALMVMVVRSGKAVASTTSLWRLAAVVPFAWLVFEGTHSLLATQWLYRSVPRALLHNRHWAVWVLFVVTTLWALEPWRHGEHSPRGA